MKQPGTRQPDESSRTLKSDIRRAVNAAKNILGSDGKEPQPRLVPGRVSKALFKTAKVALVFGVGAGSGLVAADFIGTPAPVNSVIETYGQPNINPDTGLGYADDLISITNRGIEELGVTGHVDDIRDETTGTPDPGEQVKVTHLESPIFHRVIIKTENAD